MASKSKSVKTTRKCTPNAREKRGVVDQAKSKRFGGGFFHRGDEYWVFKLGDFEYRVKKGKGIQKINIHPWFIEKETGAVINPDKSTLNKTAKICKQNYTEQVKTSDGKTVFVNVDEVHGGKWRAEGYPVIDGRIKRVGKPKVATGESESDAYDKLVMSLERNPGGARLTSDEKKDLMERPGLWMYFPTFRIAWFKGKGFVKQKWPRKGKRNEGVSQGETKDATRTSETGPATAIATARGMTTATATATASPTTSSPTSTTTKAKTSTDTRSPSSTTTASPSSTTTAPALKGKVNPKSKSTRNLDEIDQAAELVERFQGRPAERVTESVRGNRMRDDFSHFGWVDQLVFVPPSDVRELECREISDYYNERYEAHNNTEKAWMETQKEFDIPLLVYDTEGDKIELVCSADAKQLYFLGKKQASFIGVLSDFQTDRNKDRVDLGELLSITYEALKSQLGDTEERPYYHVFGEEGGYPPRAYFDMLNKELMLMGGTYDLNEAERGIIN